LALGNEPTSGAEGAEEAAEQPVVIGQPVEGGGAEDGIRCPFELEVLQVGAAEGDAVAEGGSEVRCRFIDHVLRLVDGDDMAVGEAFEQKFSEAAGATAGIDDSFAAVEGQAIEHRAAPIDVRIGDAVVALGVPFAQV
jgi:hypothetical protein